MHTVQRTLSILLLLLLLAACTPTVPVPTMGPQQASTSIPPTAKVVPTVPPPSTTPASQPIVITLPKDGSEVASPVAVSGVVAVVPFESTLLGQVYDAAGQVIGAGPIMVQGSMGDPGPVPFAGEIAFTAAQAGPGRIEVADISPKDGSVLVSATVNVALQTTAVPAAATIEIPRAGAETTLPLHILAHAGQPGDQVVAALLWQDGAVLTRTYTLLDGKDGRGLLAESLWWQADVPPLPFPPTQPATLEVRTTDGTILAHQNLTVVSWDDPNIQQITVYFLLGEELQPVTLNITKTVRIGTAALNELLWGPPPPNLAGFGTALPLPNEVLSYPGRGPDWGPRVRLIELKIENGVATANFSREFRAYGGGSLRVTLIREQITRTLKEFPSVQQVVIAVDGQTEGVLEP
jgi:hypothetical protein